MAEVEMVLQASRPEDCEALAAYYRANPRESVFPRQADELTVASREAALMHVACGGEIVAVAGIFDTDPTLPEIGGILVTANGYGLQKLLMQALAVQFHIMNDQYRFTIACMFADNRDSIASAEAAYFEEWKGIPTSIQQKKAEQAAGRPFKVYHAPTRQLPNMASRLEKIAENPRFMHRERDELLNLELQHPLFTRYREALRAVAQGGAFFELLDGVAFAPTPRTER